MNVRKIVVAIAAVGLTASLGGTVTVSPALAHSTGIHDNCTKLHQKWPHGVGRRNARDRTSGTPVRNFYRNTDAYNRADSHNGTLDRDNDGIACEKA